MKVNLGTPDNSAVTVLIPQGTGVITDTTSLGVSISNATAVAEGGELVFTVSLIGGTSTTPITIPLFYAGTADPVLDIDNQPVLVTIPAGATSVTVTVPTSPDSIAEGDEVVLVSLGTPSNPAVLVLDNEGAGIINDATALNVSISDSPTVNEGGDLVYTVTLNGTSTKAITIPLTYTGTASDGTDFSGVE